MEYYWTDQKEIKEKLKNIFDSNSIRYHIKTERMIVSSKTDFTRRHTVYIFIFEPGSKAKAERLVIFNEDLTGEYCYSSKIYDKHLKVSENKNSKDEKKKKGLDDILLSMRKSWLDMLLIIILAVSIPLAMYKRSVPIILISIIALTIYGIAKQKHGIIYYLLATAYGIWAVTIYNRFYYSKEIESIMSLDVTSLSICMILCLALILLHIVTTILGMRFYTKKSEKERLIFLFSIIGCFILVSFTIIYNFAYVYENYHNQIYAKYSDVFMSNKYCEEERIDYYRREAKIQDNGKQKVVVAYYNKVNLLSPYMISVTEIDNNGNAVNVPQIIQPGTDYCLNNSGYASNHYEIEHFTWSLLTYIGKDDKEMSAVSDGIKHIFIEETILAYLMQTWVIPILIFVFQKIVESYENKNDAKSKG